MADNPDPTADPSPSIAKMEHLWAVCYAFIRGNGITCPETVYQTDRVAEGSLEFIAEICQTVGYDND